jgi:hypothetical protein
MGNVMSDGTPAIDRLSRYGRWKNKLAEIISYGAYSARDVVISAIIDDGINNRPNRTNIFDPDFTVCGISSGPHAQHLRMVDIALAGNYIEGDVEPVKREIKVKTEKETLNFDRFETKDKSGYLIPVGNMFVGLNGLKLFKEGQILHVERTIVNEDNEALTSHFRFDVPFDFEPITVLARQNLNQELFLYIAKPAGTPDPNQEIVITNFTLPPDPSRPNDKMDLKIQENQDFFLFSATPGKNKEEITIKLKGKSLTFDCKRTVIGVDEEGEFEKVVTAQRTINLPVPVPLRAFNLVSQGKDGFQLKITKPTSSTKPGETVEIPIQEGHFNF